MRKCYLFFALALLMGLGTVQTLSAQTQARFYTDKGDFDVELFENLVPITANNFIDLADTLYYDGVIWHRVVANFVIQSGDPTGTGSGGPGYTIPDEFHVTLRHYKKGILSMANSGPNTGGSQFFITLKQTLWLDNLHSVFGEVINGMNVVDSIAAVTVDANDRPINPPVIDSIRVLAPTSRPAVQENAVAILGGNFPNPFTAETAFAYGLIEPAQVTLRVMDPEGRVLRVLNPGFQAAGDHLLKFDGRDAAGNLLPSGLYFYQLQVPGFVDSKAMLLTR